jgi:alanyl-tRNA synthetase
MIVSESSIGQGVRRIEMVAGEAAERRWRETADSLRTTARALRARPNEVPERVAGLQEQLRRAARELEQARKRGATGATTAKATVEEVGGLRYASLSVDSDAGASSVDDIIDSIFAEQLGGDGVAVVVSRDNVAVKIGPAAQRAGIHAGSLAGAAAKLMDGKGGGRPDFGRGSVKNAARRDDALALVRDTVSRQAPGNAA